MSALQSSSKTSKYADNFFYLTSYQSMVFKMKTKSVLFIIAVVKFIYSEKPHKLKKNQSTLDLTDHNSYFNIKLKQVGMPVQRVLNRVLSGLC